LVNEHLTIAKAKGKLFKRTMPKSRDKRVRSGSSNGHETENQKRQRLKGKSIRFQCQCFMPNFSNIVVFLLEEALARQQAAEEEETLSSPGKPPVTTNTMVTPLLHLQKGIMQPKMTPNFSRVQRYVEHCKRRMIVMPALMPRNKKLMWGTLLYHL
jgi:hypothetical protein